MTSSSTDPTRDATIRDFGEQWTAYRENEGYYASRELFADLLGPFADTVSVKDARVADIGSGTGRIVGMLLAEGASHVTAVEPSAAFEVLRENTRDHAARITYVNGPGESLPGRESLDLVFSFGVLHHVPDPAPIVRRAYEALRPGGRFVAWLYGHEGNELYLALAQPLRRISTALPHAALDRLSGALRWPLDAYVVACRQMPSLPMARYMTEHIGKLSPEVRKLTIYDQLNPAYAKYYRRHEAEALFRDAGFGDVRLHHRHGYSWTVVATRD
jgi:SAM-dependent methyltransferase